MKRNFVHILAPLAFLCLSGIAQANSEPAVNYVSSAGTISTKIVGGNQASSGEYPFIVSLQDSIGHFCGASVISPTFVMSAAHCSGANMDAVIGLHDQNKPGKSQRISVKKQINHPKYGNGYDIAVYELSEPIDPSLYSPVQLGSSSDVSVGTMSTVIGWGLLDQNDNDLPNKLQEVQVPIVSHSQCADAYAAEGESINKTSEICAGYSKGGKDSCQGDSGGPLVIKKNGQFVQLGVVSWGLGCAEPNFYGVYAHVANLKSWIQSQVPNLGDDGGDTGGGDTGDSCYSNNVTLKLEMDQYGNETSWEIRNKSGNKVASGNGYDDYQVVSKSIDLSDGDYTFTIFDTYGDGMTVGNGSYKLSDTKGNVIKSGGDFGKSESVSFCTVGSNTGGGDTGGGDTGGDCFKSKVKLILQIDDQGYETDWEISDNSGKAIYSGGDYKANKRIKKRMSLSNGNYKFSIYDAYGDGLTSGKGSFKLKDDNKEMIIKGSSFGKEVSKNFCISN